MSEVMCISSPSDGVRRIALTQEELISFMSYYDNISWEYRREVVGRLFEGKNISKPIGEDMTGVLYSLRE